MNHQYACINFVLLSANLMPIAFAELEWIDTLIEICEMAISLKSLSIIVIRNFL